jgi:hypothetical protein
MRGTQPLLNRLQKREGNHMADSRIPLSDLIADLRLELAQAQAKGQGLEPRLRVEEAEIELQVVVSREGGSKASVKFWVVNAEAQGKLANATTQKIRLKLKSTGTGSRVGLCPT